MGPSGSGKSSLLAFICGTLDPAFTAEGRVLLGEVDLAPLPPERRRVGILFQDDLLFPHLSVGGNLAFACRLGCRARAARAGWRRRSPRSASPAWRGGIPPRSPAASGPGSPCCACCCPSRAPCSWTSLSGGWTSACAIDSAIWCSAGRAERRLPALLVTHDRADAAAASGKIVTVDEDFSNDHKE